MLKRKVISKRLTDLLASSVSKAALLECTCRRIDPKLDPSQG